jgi:hypothetical protein
LFIGVAEQLAKIYNNKIYNGCINNFVLTTRSGSFIFDVNTTINNENEIKDIQQKFEPVKTNEQLIVEKISSLLNLGALYNEVALIKKSP